MTNKVLLQSLLRLERNEIEAEDWVNRQRLAPKKVLFLRERAREREGDEKESWVQKKIVAFAFVVVELELELILSQMAQKPMLRG